VVDAYWDSSALVPLCLKQQATPVVQALRVKYRLAVWWSACVEVRGAIARLNRIGFLTPNEQVQAQVALDRMLPDCLEVLPTEQLREQAMRLVDRFPLKAADAFQLAAAIIWCLGHPAGRAFISGDIHLLEAARQLGFDAIQA
jgi:predicted nucleic acid-binding protein